LVIGAISSQSIISFQKWPIDTFHSVKCKGVEAEFTITIQLISGWKWIAADTTCSIQIVSLIMITIANTLNIIKSEPRLTNTPAIYTLSVWHRHISTVNASFSCPNIIYWTALTINAVIFAWKRWTIQTFTSIFYKTSRTSATHVIWKSSEIT